MCIRDSSVNHQLFADDTQLQKSAPLSEVTNLTKELNACTDDIKTWMTENQFKLTDDKTEALLFPFSSSLKPSTVSIPDSIILGSHNIPFSDSARNLGFILDSKLSMKKHVSDISGSGPAYLSELLHVYTPSRIRLSSSDTRMLEIQQYKRTLSCFGPHIWNSLPQDLRHCSTLSSFKAELKTFLFLQYFHPN